MPSKLKVAIIGAGSMGTSHVAAYQGTGLAEIAAICDIVPHRAQRLIDRNKLEGCAVYEDYHDVLAREDISAISVCTPNYLHHPMTMDSLSAGKHVLCEKPLAMNAAEAREMTEAAARLGRVNMTGFTYHYIPSFEFASRLVRDGEFGDIHRIKADYTMGMYSRESTSAGIHWRLLKAQSGGGVVGDLAAHILHMGRRLFGEAKTVTAELHRLVPVGEEPSQCSILIEYADGAVGNYEASWHAPGRTNFQRLEVSGSKGAFIYEFAKPSHLDIYAWEGLGRHTGDFVTVEAPGAPNFVPELVGHSWNNHAHHHAMVQELTHFINCINDGKVDAGCPSFHDGMKVQEIVDAAILSSETGRRVTLEGLK